jgi:hypothetical protein
VFSLSLDALNDKPFLEYLDPDQSALLLKLKKRSASSFKKLHSYPQIQELFSLIGEREQYRINTGFNQNWIHRKAGWNEGSKFPTQPFREIDFLNILLGSDYRARTSIGLSDQHLDEISSIRIDFDFKLFDAEQAIKLALEIEDKLASIGLPVFFFLTGNRGIQSCIPLPATIPYQSAQLLWTKLENYLATDIAKLDVCSVNSYLRLPLGRHSLTMLLSLFFDPHAGLFCPIDQQLDIYKKSLIWSTPEHITDPLRDNYWEKFVSDQYISIPQKTVQSSMSIEHKIEDEEKPTADQNWSDKWKLGTALQVGEFNAWLTHGLGFHSAYELYGQDAPEHLKKLAAIIPGADTRLQDRCSQVDYLWKTFVPRSQYQKTNQSAASKQLMMDTDQSQETIDHAERIFEFLKQHKPSTNRSVNGHLLEVIRAVLHGISLSDGAVLIISIDDLCSYINSTGSTISRRTITRIVEDFTIPEARKIRTRNAPKTPLAIWYRVKAKANFSGSEDAAGFELLPKFIKL